MLTNKLSKEEYDQMASEISGASVSVWNDSLTDTDEGIKLEDLWVILDKYLKPADVTHNEVQHPNYGGC